MIKIDDFKCELPLTLLLTNDVVVAFKEAANELKKTKDEPVLEEFIPLKKRCFQVYKDGVDMQTESSDKKDWMSSVQLWNHSDNQTSQPDSNHNKIGETIKEAANELKKTKDEPVLEEFIPLKKRCLQVYKDGVEMQTESSDKKDWMSSVQLWNHSDNQTSEPDSNHNKIGETIKESAQENLSMTDKLYSFVAMKEDNMEEAAEAKLSFYIPGTSSPSEGLKSSVSSSKISSSITSASPIAQIKTRTDSEPLHQPMGRIQRWCWSQEVHKRFVSALKELGGPHVATPWQIKDLMQVDGLSTALIKSHLQKYRLHTHKVPADTTFYLANQPAFALEGLRTRGYQCSEFAKMWPSRFGIPDEPFEETERRDFVEDKISESSSWETPNHNCNKSIYLPADNITSRAQEVVKGLKNKIHYK